MDSKLILIFLTIFFYYVAMLNITLVFFARPDFLKRFSFNYGNFQIRCLFALLLFVSSAFLGFMTCILRYFNSIIIL
ncbi:MAG: hypothetical protein CES88_10755 [Halobacteriovorax sp. JY17]|nr:MAG: hypothetical protein CES88_10755 [Halobacteriovorax sp. JY17]